VLLDEKADLAREWTVVVLTPRFGAVLVARDLEEVQAGSSTLESGRLFDGWSSFRRDEALHEALRLRNRLGDRLPPAALTAVDKVFDRVRDLPATPGESRADAALSLFTTQAERSHTSLRKAGATGSPEVADDAEGVRRWAGSAGVTSSGVLPVAVLAVRVTHATDGEGGPIGRTETRQQQAVIDLLVARLRPGDRATKVGPDNFLLFLPALSHDEAVAFGYGLVADFVAAARSAFLSATANVALTVTRRRPLPEADLQRAVQWAITQNAPVVTIDT
jgi:hypothetical protein